MKDMIVNVGMKYYYQTSDGTRKQISSAQAWRIFSEWKKADLTIRRKYGMNGKVTWVWAE